MKSMRRYEEALYYSRIAMSLQDKLEELEYYQVVSRCKYCQALILKELGAWDESKRLIIESLRANKPIHFESKLFVAHAMDALATILASKSQYTNAMKQGERALDMKKRLTPINHPERAKSFFGR